MRLENNQGHIFPVPPIITEKYNELYDLVQNQSDNGLLRPDLVAKFINKDKAWLLRTTYAGMCPFAFGSDKGVGRGNCCFHVMPFFFYQTQGTLIRAIPDRELAKSMISV